LRGEGEKVRGKRRLLKEEDKNNRVDPDMFKWKGVKVADPSRIHLKGLGGKNPERPFWWKRKNGKGEDPTNGLPMRSQTPTTH